MRLIFGLFIASLIGVTSEAHADETYKPKIIPSCEVFQVSGVGKICGFQDIGDWKRILRADAELVSARNKLKIKNAQIEALTLQVESLEGQLGEYKGSLELCLNRVDTVSSQLIEMNKKYEEERARPRIGSAVAWSVAAVAGALLVGYVGNDLL